MQRRAPFQTTVLVLAAMLALAAGLAIVFVTSPESVKRSPPIFLTQFAPRSSVQSTATENPSTPDDPGGTPVKADSGAGTLTDTAVNPAVIASATSTPGGETFQATQTPTVVRELTETPTLVDTIVASPTLSPTLILPAVPTAASSPAPLPTFLPGASAIAVVALEEGVSARLRDAPAGNVIGGVASGTQVQVLGGRQTTEDLVWVEIIDETGQNGWIAEEVLEILATPEPG